MSSMRTIPYFGMAVAGILALAMFIGPALADCKSECLGYDDPIAVRLCERGCELAEMEPLGSVHKYRVAPDETEMEAKVITPCLREYISQDSLWDNFYPDGTLIAYRAAGREIIEETRKVLEGIVAQYPEEVHPHIYEQLRERCIDIMGGQGVRAEMTPQ